MSKTSRAARVAEFKKRLNDLGFESYGAYLAGPHWANVRRRFWGSKLSKSCGGCGGVSRLELHHRTYKRLGAEYLTDLVLVCRDCHGRIHEYEKRSKVHMWRSTNRILRKRRKETARAEHHTM